MPRYNSPTDRILESWDRQFKKDGVTNMLRTWIVCFLLCALWYLVGYFAGDFTPAEGLSLGTITLAWVLQVLSWFE